MYAKITHEIDQRNIFMILALVVIVPLADFQPRPSTVQSNHAHKYKAADSAVGSMALRWGICSAGKISHDFVVGLKSLPETEHQVVAVAARSLESASKFAKNHTIPRHYGSYQELADDKEV